MFWVKLNNLTSIDKAYINIIAMGNTLLDLP